MSDIPIKSEPTAANPEPKFDHLIFVHHLPPNFLLVFIANTKIKAWNS